MPGIKTLTPSEKQSGCSYHDDKCFEHDMSIIIGIKYASFLGLLTEDG